VSNYRLFKNGSKVDLIFYNNKNELYNIYLRFTKKKYLRFTKNAPCADQNLLLLIYQLHFCLLKKITKNNILQITKKSSAHPLDRI
jgi:hypothetical protein